MAPSGQHRTFAARVQLVCQATESMTKMMHPSKVSDALEAEIMRAVTDNDAGWLDRLFALLTAERLDVGEPFTLTVGADVFEETRRRGSGAPINSSHGRSTRSLRISGISCRHLERTEGFRALC